MKNGKRIMAVVLASVLVFSLSMPPVQAAKKKTKAKVYSVTITKPDTTTLVLKKKKTYKLKTKVKATGKISKKVTFKSSNPKVVKVSSKGKLTAVKNGTAKITVRSKANSKKKDTLTVKVGTPVSKIKLNKTQINGTVGQKVQLKKSVSPSKATVKTVSFKSSNTAVAKVNSKGEVRLVKEGTAKVTATAKDGSGKKAVCRVVVKKKATSEAEKTTEEPGTEDKIPEYEGYTLQWHDEFDGDKLNENDWNYETHEPGWVNNELQAYVKSDENVYVKDGKLVIKPVKTGEGENATYTSGRINTQNKHDFTYGRFEVRAKVPTGKGYLPAFWMMPTNENLYGQWPRCGEIDIMEVMGSDVSKAYGTIHYGNPHSESQGTKVLTKGNFADEYHVFSCEWEPGSIKWYMDGELYHQENDWHSTTVGQGTVSYPAPFDQPFYMILNLAVGGSWVGYPDETTDFENQAFVVDWVRAYQKESYDENVTKPEKEVILRDPDENGNYTNNGDFSEAEDLDDDENWKFLTDKGGEGSAKIENKEIVIETTNAGTVDYSVQLVQGGIPLKRGNVYTVSFDAYADEARTMKVDVSAPDRSYQRYLDDTVVDLTTDKKTYTYTFNMEDKDDANGRLEFNLGNTDSVSTVHISNVSIKSTGTFEIDDSKKALSDGNYIYNGSFQEGTNRLAYWDVVDAGNHAEYGVTSLADGRRLKLSTTGCTSAGDVVLKQEELPLTANGNYELSFEASADAAKEITVHVAGFDQTFTLSEEKETYTYKFSTGESVNAPAIAFDLGVNGTVYLDNVRLVEDRLIKNGSFNAGLSGYEVYAYTTSDVSYVVDSISEDNAFDITIKDTGDADWKIQLKQNNVKVEKDQWYTLKLDAKSSVDRKLMYAIQRDGSTHKNDDGSEDWTPYVQDKVELTESYQTIKKTFQMKYATDLESILSISMGAVDGTRIDTQHRICIDNISLEPATEEEIEAANPTIEPVEPGTEMIKNGSFADGSTNWISAITSPGAATDAFTDGKATYNITNVGDQDWNVQLKQEGITLEQGCSYVLKFKASSTAGRTIKCAFLTSTYDWYGGADIALTAKETKDVEVSFTVGTDKETTDAITLVISMGKIADVDTPSTITLSDFSLMKKSAE